MSAVNRDVIADREFDTLSIFDHFWRDQSDINAIDTVTDSGDRLPTTPWGLARPARFVRKILRVAVCI